MLGCTDITLWISSSRGNRTGVESIVEVACSEEARLSNIFLVGVSVRAPSFELSFSISSLSILVRDNIKEVFQVTRIHCGLFVGLRRFQEKH